MSDTHAFPSIAEVLEHGRKVVVSDAFLDWVAEHHPSLATRIATVPNPVRVGILDRWVAYTVGERISVFLDDEEVRVPKEGWVWVKTPQEAVDLLKTGRVERISLDNDLGLSGYGPMTEGKHVAAWIEAEAEAGRLPEIPYLHVHTRNPDAKQQIKAAFRNAKAFWGDERYQKPVR